MRVCQFRHFGKSDSDAAIVTPPPRRVIFYSMVGGEAAADDAVASDALLKKCRPQTRTRRTASKHGIAGKMIRSTTCPKSHGKFHQAPRRRNQSSAPTRP